jgi:hypothetical protein
MVACVVFGNLVANTTNLHRNWITDIVWGEGGCTKVRENRLPVMIRGLRIRIFHWYFSLRDKTGYREITFSYSNECKT